MIPWYIYYDNNGKIFATAPEHPLNEKRGTEMRLDQYSPIDQIELFNEFRKMPRGFYIEENPLTGKPRLVKEQKDTKNYIKSNLVEIVEQENSDIDVLIEKNKIMLVPHFNFKGKANIYVTAKDPNFVVASLEFNIDCLEHSVDTRNKRFFVNPYGKTFALKQNKYSIQED